MNALMIFFGQLLVVFLLGFQSRCVNAGQAPISFCTSVCIGACQLWMYKCVPEANGIEMAAFLLGGPIGIVLSIYVHARVYKRKEEMV